MPVSRRSKAKPQRRMAMTMAPTTLRVTTTKTAAAIKREVIAAQDQPAPVVAGAEPFPPLSLFVRFIAHTSARMVSTMPKCGDT